MSGVAIGRCAAWKAALHEAERRVDEKLLYTWRLFVRHLGPLLALFAGAVALSQIPVFFTLDSPSNELTLEGFIASVASLLISAVVSPLSIAAAFVILDSGTHGAAASIGKALRRALGRIVPLVFWWSIVTLLTVVGTIFFIVPGIYAWVKWSFALFILMDLNRRGRGNPLSQSFELTRGYGWYILGAVLLFSIPLLLMGMATAFASIFWQESGRLIWIPFGLLAALFYSPVYVFLFVCYREATLAAEPRAPEAVGPAGR